MTAVPDKADDYGPDSTDGTDYAPSIAIPAIALGKPQTPTHVETLSLYDKTTQHEATQNSKPIQRNHIDISYWNVNSFYNCNDLINTLNSDIYCLNETWLMNEPSYLPNHFTKFNSFFYFAEKEHVKGRAKGGLLLIVNKNLKTTLLYTDDKWIFALITKNNFTFIIGLIYFPPISDIFNYLPQLDIIIRSLRMHYGNETPIYIGGDFNARVSSLNQLNINIIQNNSNLYPDRTSCDIVILNKRGKDITFFFEINGFFLLNGRTKGDYLANFTYHGGAGTSVIDLIWSNFKGSDYINKDPANFL